jgi:hypothetical protein
MIGMAKGGRSRKALICAIQFEINIPDCDEDQEYLFCNLLFPQFVQRFTINA